MSTAAGRDLGELEQRRSLSKQSPGLVSPQESLVDVRFQEARVAIPGHQAVDELLRRIK